MTIEAPQAQKYAYRQLGHVFHMLTRVCIRSKAWLAARACHSSLLACLALLGRGAHVACAPRLRLRQFFSSTLLFDAFL